jgi:hypothetical protein
VSRIPEISIIVKKDYSNSAAKRKEGKESAENDLDVGGGRIRQTGCHRRRTKRYQNASIS